ncbi:hypothetical protein RYX45_21870, partial [Alkalihalophilus pseudofirmus]
YYSFFIILTWFNMLLTYLQYEIPISWLKNPKLDQTHITTKLSAKLWSYLQIDGIETFNLLIP